MAEQLPRLLATILKAKEDPDHKIIVFFVAARIVQASYSPSVSLLRPPSGQPPVGFLLVVVHASAVSTTPGFLVFSPSSFLFFSRNRLRISLSGVG